VPRANSLADEYESPIRRQATGDDRRVAVFVGIAFGMNYLVSRIYCLAGTVGVTLRVRVAGKTGMRPNSLFLPLPLLE
jgi:hypothetical protein